MVKLTKKNKTLSYDEKRDIEQLKRDMIEEAGLRCPVCKKPFSYYLMPQIAHRIRKGDRHYKKYGYEVINHPFNLRITCSHSKCNSSVSVNAEKTEGKELINEIMEDLNNK